MERQTERSKETFEATLHRVRRHDARADYLVILRRAHIIVTRDTQRDVKHAMRAAE